MKQSRTRLQSSLTFAGNIMLVADYGGIDVYVDFFFSNAALLKTVAVMSLQTLSQKEADNYSPEQQNKKPKQAPTKATHTTHKTRERLWQT